MRVEQSFFVGIQDVGPDNRASDRALLEALSDVAALHGDLVDQGFDADSHKRFAWVVVGWHLEITGERPRGCSTYVARTWGTGHTSLFASRDFDLRDEDGRVFGVATSLWTAADVQHGSVVRLTPEIMDPYSEYPDDKVLPDVRLARRGKVELSPERVTTFKITKAMVDGNHHVHNTVYLDLATEAMPEGVDEQQFDHVEVSYRKEVPPRATVRLLYAQQDGKHYVMVRSADDAVLHAVVTLW